MYFQLAISLNLEKEECKKFKKFLKKELIEAEYIELSNRLKSPYSFITYNEAVKILNLYLNKTKDTFETDLVETLNRFISGKI